MRIRVGYLYHIKDKFFDDFKDYNLMQNHEYEKARPTYFTIKDKNILWFIPLSTKTQKYRKIIDSKIKKYGFCNTILIREILGKEVAILLQNAFPTLENYVDHVHLVHGLPAKISNSVRDEILHNFKRMLAMKKNGIDLFFVDIDKIRNELEQTLVNN